MRSIDELTRTLRPLPTFGDRPRQGDCATLSRRLNDQVRLLVLTWLRGSFEPAVTTATGRTLAALPGQRPRMPIEAIGSGPPTAPMLENKIEPISKMR